MWHDTFHWSHHISAFSAGNLAFTCFCLIAIFSSIFSLLFGFLSVSMSFLWEHICLNVYYGNIFLNFGLVGIKMHKIKVFFLPSSNKFAIQNNPPMQLRLIFYKRLIKTNWKSENFKVIDLVVFQQLKKFGSRGAGKFVLLLLFLSIHVHFQ